MHLEDEKMLIALALSLVSSPKFNTFRRELTNRGVHQKCLFLKGGNLIINN